MMLAGRGRVISSRRAAKSPSGDEKSELTLLDLMVLCKEVERRLRRHRERIWLTGIPASETSPVGQLRWLAERFSAAYQTHTMRSPQREIRLAALAPDPGAGLWYSQKTRRKQPTVFEKDPWLALQRRIRGLLGVDFHARALSAILDLAFDRLETEPDAGNQQKVIALASLLIQLEAAELRPDAAKPGAALPQLIERERTRRRAEVLAAAEALRGPRIIVAKPTLAEPPPIPTANGSEISPGPETDYITYWDACVHAGQQAWRNTSDRVAGPSWTFSKRFGMPGTRACTVHAFAPIHESTRASPLPCSNEENLHLAPARSVAQFPLNALDVALLAQNAVFEAPLFQQREPASLPAWQGCSKRRRIMCWT